MAMNVRVAKFLGIVIIIMLTLNMVPFRAINAENTNTESKELTLYKTLLRRALNIPGLSTSLKDRINKLLNSHPSNESEELNLIKKAKELLSEIRVYVERNVNIGDVIEKEKLQRIINILSMYANETHAVDIIKSLSEARKYLDKGDVKNARKILKHISPSLSNLKVNSYSRELEDSILSLFTTVSSNQSSVNAVENAILNINITINILTNVKENLIKNNASEESILALDKAINILDNVVTILNNTVLIIEKTGVGNRVGNITKNMAEKHILNRLNDLEFEVRVLMNETIYVEESLNISLTSVKSNLTKASSLLNQSKEALDNGDLENSIKLLAMAKSIISNVKETLKEYIEELKETLKGKEKLKKYVSEKLNEVIEEYNDVKTKFQDLYNKSLKYNCSEAINVLVKINITINKVGDTLVKAKLKINESSYGDALMILETAESILDNIDNALDRVENMLDVASEVSNEVIEEINGLRDSLRKLNESTLEILSGNILNVTLNEIAKLNIELDRAENLTLSGDVEAAVNIINSVELKIKRLSECIESIPDIMDKISDLKNEINKLREKYSNVENIQKLLDKAEELIDKALSMVEESVKEANPGILEKAEDMLNKVNRILEAIEEGKEYVVSFMILDEYNMPVLNSTIVFNGTIFYNGELTLCSEGVYNLTVGNITSGYVFDHWDSYGDVKILNPYSQVTNVSIDGNGAIILRVRRTYPSTLNYTVRFWVRDLSGLTISNAYIVFNGSQYRNGDSINITAGEYSLEVGSIPEGYKFEFWSSTGGIVIKDHKSNKTSVIIDGDGSIVMVLRKIERKANVRFYIKDTDGNILDEGSIILGGEKYKSGENATIKKDVYILSAGELPDGYKFIRWNTTGDIKVSDPTKPLTTVQISGDGEIVMVVQKIVSKISAENINTINVISKHDILRNSIILSFFLKPKNSLFSKNHLALFLGI